MRDEGGVKHLFLLIPGTCLLPGQDRGQGW